MAEGDSIWRLARRLDARLAGRRVLRSDLRVARHATRDLAGATVEEVASRGKHLLLRTHDGRTLHSHLRMSGSWRCYAPGARWFGPRHAVRAVLELEGVTAVAHAVPVLDLLPTRDERLVVGHLGPDLLGDDWDPEEARRRLRAAPGRPLVSALLDQRNLAGIGNLYAVEGCFLGRCSPWTPVADVAGLPDLVEDLRRRMDANARSGVQTTTGERARGRTHWVYGRAGRPCRRCRTAVAFRPGTNGADPWDRETWWCPRCQPGPVPAWPRVSPRPPAGPRSRRSAVAGGGRGRRPPRGAARW